MFTAPEQLLDYFTDVMSSNRGELGLNYVAYGDEDKLPRFPAVKVASGDLRRELHATRQFENTFEVEFTVFHGNLNATHAQRSKQDLELASRIRTLFHSDMTLKGGVIQGWFVREGPGVFMRPKAPAVVTTRMVWRGITVEPFTMP